MTSVASEPVAFSSRAPQFQRSQSATASQDGDAPFAQMLEASTPPNDPAPRRREPSDPAAPPQRAATPASPKKRNVAETPGDRTADASEPANIETASKDEAAVEVEVAVETESPVIAQVQPETPVPEEDAGDGSESQDADIVGVQAQAEIPPVPTPVAPEIAVAAAATVMPETIAAAPAEGDAAAELAAKPAQTAGVPAAKSAPETPVAAPVIDAPELPADLQAKGVKEVPEIKGKADVKPAELQIETAKQPVDGEIQQILPQRPQAEHGQAKTAPEEASLRADGKPQPEPKQPAEPAQLKPALPPTPAAGSETASTTNAALPTSSVVVPDAASVGASQARAPLLTASAVPVSGIAVEIATQARAGNNRFEIRLDPPELGRIDVRLDVDQDGNVKSRLVIERSDTYDLLRRDSSTLERALQQAGLKTSDNGLEFTLRDQGSAQRETRDQSQRNAERAIIPDADILPAEAANGYGRVLGLGGGVDIRI